MKVGIQELRDLVAEAVRRTLAEAPKKGSKRAPKLIPMHSEESEDEQRERMSRGLKGYALSDANDYARPLGPASVVKRQGASGMGGWTGEAVKARMQQKIHEMQIRRLVRMIVAEEIGNLRK